MPDWWWKALLIWFGLSVIVAVTYALGWWRIVPRDEIDDER